MSQRYHMTKPDGRGPDQGGTASTSVLEDSPFFELASEGMLLASARGPELTALSANPAAREMLGIPAPRLTALTPEAVAVLDGHSESYRGRLLVRCGDATLDLRATLQPVGLPHERTFALLFERNTKRDAERLAAEVEELTYAVSHDLATPLRALDGFSRILQEDYTGSLDAEGRDYLARISAASRRMSAMLDGLLRLSRAGRGELRRSRVDLSELARLTGDRLAAEARAAGREVEFSVRDGLVAEADPESLAVAVEALLENAFRFTGHRPVARIEFGATLGPERRAYFIRDDGAGFEPQDAEKLFRVFQQSHSQEEYEKPGEYPAVGVGLALVRKVVERHGGRVWAAGEPGRGSTFYFTLRGAGATDEEGTG